MISINKIKIFTSIFSFLILFTSILNAQWEIPDDVKNTKMPVVPTYKLVKQGKELFKLNCSSCHGTPGEGNNIVAINATDIGTKSFQVDNNPGATFFKIDEGMGAMPSFKDKFNEEEKWNIVYYVKSFDETFKISGEKIQTLNGVIDLKTDESAMKVFANVSLTDKNGNTLSNEGIDIVFYVKRIFGNLPISDAIPTNQVGTAALNFPNDIPGDEEGMIEVIASFKDQDTYGTDMKSTVLNWGTRLHFENPVLERSLWGPNDRVPLWLLFSYLAITIGVWLTILYVIFQMTRIKKVG